MLRTFTALAVAAAAGALAPATGATTFWGGGAVPDRVAKPTRTAYFASFGVGLRGSADGRRMDVRVAFAVRTCGKHASTSTDAVVATDLAPDGTFHLKNAPARTAELGRVLVTMDGTAVAGRADGTVSVRTAWGCGLSARPWTARQVDPQAPAAGAAPAAIDGLLYGITFQNLDRAPHPFVLKVEDGGTVAHGFTTWTQHCTGRDDDGPFTGAVDWQTVLPERPIAAGAWTYHRDDRETAAGRRQGVRSHNLFTVKGTFDGAVLRGTLADTRTYRKGRLHETCRTGRAQPFVVLP